MVFTFVLVAYNVDGRSVDVEIAIWCTMVGKNIVLKVKVSTLGRWYELLVFSLTSKNNGSRRLRVPNPKPRN